jgi:phosphotransferase system  glucose/maltose/N-acetylglucosamine-specific IIC component
MNKPFVILAVILGVVFLLMAVIYVIEPAKSLPVFFPGHDPALTKHHYTHALGMFILACCAFIFVWFQSGKNSVHEEKK